MMDRSKNAIAVGIVFLSCGVSFAGVGMAIDQLTFSVLGPAFMTIGVVLIATAGKRAKSDSSEPDSDAD